MLPDDFRDELDQLWTEFWPATDIKPLAVVDFINLVFFARHLEEVQEKKERAAGFYGKPVETPVYTEEQQQMRWSSFHNLNSHDLYGLFNRKNDGLLHFLTSKEAFKKWTKFDTEEKILIPTPDLLAGTVKLVSRLDVADSTTRAAMNQLLLEKAATPAKPGVPDLNKPETILENEYPVKKRFQVNDWKASILLLVIFISGFVAAFVYFGSKQKNNTAAVFTSENNATADSGNDTLVTPAAEATPAKGKAKKTVEPSGKEKKQGATKPKIIAPVREPTLAAQKKDKATAAIKGKYKVISKAYFHNKPDEHTRRNAFVVHWNNSYTTLKALDEKNDFVYVVFHNHLNQTSKGWLRKKDLIPVE